ncbi:MAG: glycosyltransferase family 4 protein [Deltaproteobacteria bacterium]|nr:glycosyltransferase family 4 protein [Deltaproteobacteria bacterium]
MSFKKILILDTGKEWGGGTNSLLELLKRADRKRFGFTALFCNNYKMGAGSDISTELDKIGIGFVQLGRGRRSAYLKGMKEVVRSVLFFSGALKKKYIFSIEYINRILPDSKRIAAVLKEGGYDLLYMNNQPSSNLEGILAAKSLGVPCIQHSRIDVALNPFEADAVNNWVNRVICVSNGVKDSLVGSGVSPDKCRVVYNGIDTGARPRSGSAGLREDLGIRKGSVILGTVGSLIKRKRVSLLLKAVSELKESKLACVIVGEGPEMDSLREEARRLGIRDRVVFTGFSTDALSYINFMDIFVFPSEKEGMPRVILEAMLMGKPVIAFDVAGARELIIEGRTGFLLKEGSHLAPAIKSLLQDRALMVKMGEAGRKRVIEGFGIDNYVKGVEEVFGEVLA